MSGPGDDRGWLARVFLVGPDPLDPGRAPDQITAWDSLLTWPTRLLVVLGAIVIGIIWAGSPGGIQLGWALQYGLLVAVSIVTSYWLTISLANLGVALLWVVASWDPLARRQPGERQWGASEALTWLNRQVGHVEAGATWVAVSLVWSHKLPCQLGLLAAVALLGEPIINGVARSRRFGGERAAADRAVLMMERRSLIYFATLAGLIALALQDWRQLGTFFPFMLTVIPGLAVRYVRFRLRKGQEGGQGGVSPAEVRTARLARAVVQQQVARYTGWVGPAIVVGFFALVGAVSIYERNQMASAAKDAEDGPPPPSDACVAERGGPLEPTLAMFLLADTQMHQLSGARFPGQMEVANVLVPVARRPVELDVLSTAAVVRYKQAYRDLVEARRVAGRTPPWWAHLGDFADLSCDDEMDRMLKLLVGFGPAGTKLLAGVAPGNHDSAFQGNFDWSPFWDGACNNGRLDKAASDKKLGEFLATELAHPDSSRRLTGWDRSGLSFGTTLSRFTVTPLGALGEGPARRGVVGVFVDTSDRGERDHGIAGEYGTFSGEQREQVLAAVKALREHPEAGAGPLDDPWFLVFAHIPFRELTGAGQRELGALIEALDGGGRPCRDGGDCTRPRVIALLSAHTHIAESHRHCIGQRLVRELVVGSVIDPPQQASLLEIGLDARGHAAARLSTLPAIAREGFVCAANGALGAGRCRDAMARLALEPACADLVAGAGRGSAPAETCEELERPLSVDEQIAGIVRHGGPDDPQEIVELETRRARALVGCVCRNPPPRLADACAKASESLLDDEVRSAAIAALAGDGARQAEMGCLSWAAAVVQRHKAAGMTMADAIHCGFDDPTLPPAQVLVAAAEGVACQ
jgi:3',5'-cyclic AMP phosphodiesterase CpdA